MDNFFTVFGVFGTVLATREIITHRYRVLIIVYNLGIVCNFKTVYNIKIVCNLKIVYSLNIVYNLGIVYDIQF